MSDQHEWEMQERALREEQVGANSGGDEPIVQEYRFLARALRTPPLDPIPHDFAVQTASLIESRHVTADRFEAYVQTVLVVLLAVLGAVPVVAFGVQWRSGLLQAWATPAGAASLNWIALTAACIAFSIGIQGWLLPRRRYL